jgi:hypothetical protein
MEKELYERMGAMEIEWAGGGFFVEPVMHRGGSC